MKRFVLVTVIIFCLGLAVDAQSVPADLKSGDIINLYSGAAPGSEEWTHSKTHIDVAGHDCLINVSTPTITAYLPDPAKATGSAMLICPGGAFCILSTELEGTMVADRLTKEGIAAFILEYRTIPIFKEDGTPATNGVEVMGNLMKLAEEGKKKVEAVKGVGNGLTSDWCRAMDVAPLAFADADKAMSIIRANAAMWNINPNKIGMIGFSAGSVVTLNQMQNHSNLSRPDFAAVIYGGWGDDLKVPEDACPVFLCSPTNDLFTTNESVKVYQYWKDAKKPAELHYFNDCEHGFGAKVTGKSVDAWIDLMLNFMKSNKF